ncbi:MAG: tRNA pseudouridine(13) synthase TruD, partial [Candidatus Omnitrophica bacterium]|nr:tRNA pseudouridine(13) synthase TruD [Candidatus Omnitrophota bacterium]
DMDRKMGPDLILANEFRIVIRFLNDDEIRYALEQLDFIGRYGFPNYFDDQRFGSYSSTQGFFAEKLIKREFSGALKIYLTAVYPEDKKEEKQRKRFFFQHWKNWAVCFSKAKTDFEKKAFRILIDDKGAFLKVLKMIPKEELSMFVSCFQAYLWNNLVERIVKFYSSKSLTYKGNHWNYFFYGSKEVFDYLKELNLPLPSQRTKMPNEFSEKMYKDILTEYGLKPSLFNLRKFRKIYFKSIPRKVIVVPQIENYFISEDELYRGKKALTLHFLLGRGSYGTMLIKRLFAR